MSWRRWLITGVLLLLGLAVTWSLTSPFPSSLIVLNEPLPAMASRFGSPNEAIPTNAVLRQPGRAVAWEKSRGIAVWTLEADWEKARASSAAPPDFVSRSVRLLGVNLPFPGDAAIRGRILVPHQHGS